MTAIIHPDTDAESIAAQARRTGALRIRGLSDRTIAWLFVGPTIALLLAINIFPLIWMIRLSFTSLNLSMSYLPLRFVGLDNYSDILSDEDLWIRLQTTARFVISSVALQVVIGFGLALLINRQFRSHSFWTTIILLPMMLSPAVVGNFWTLLFQPQIGPFNYVVGLFTGIPPSSFSMTGEVALAPWTIVLVDTWMWAPYVMLICLAGLRSIPDYIYEAAEVDRASAWRQFWSITLQVVIGFGLALLINRQFRGHSFWTTVILLPMMLSPAVVGNFWTFLFQPQIGLFNYVVGFFTGIPPSSFEMIGEVRLAPWTIVLVDTWMWAPYVMLICLAGLRSIPDYIYEAAEVDRASPWRQFWSITLPMVLPFLMLAVLFRAIENFKMFDMVNLLTSGGPGSVTELASITLKRAAFEKWQTGYSSAFAIILFVTVFGAANIYVKALNKVKQR